MRPILFMAALSASRSKSVLGEFYKRLTGNGKSKMCAIVAVARKIIVISNARIKEALAERDKKTTLVSDNREEVGMMFAQ